MTTAAETMIAPFYELARREYPGIFPPAPLYEDFDGPANAEARVESGVPCFRWRLGFPSPALDLVSFGRELKRAAAHEIGHVLDKLLRARGVDVEARYWAFRGFSGTWAAWQAEADRNNDYGRSPRESWADCFGAALNGEWITALGSSEAERIWNENKPVSAAAARTFFKEVAGMTQVDYASAVWIGSPNYTIGRDIPPQYVVEHWTVGTAASAIATFRSSASRVSAHYLVARDGSVYQFVRERDRAWHDGADPDGDGPEPGWNDISIGIEHEHIPGQDWPAVQLAASNALHRDIWARRGIPLTRDHCLGHNETGYLTACPGDLPIDAILGLEDDMFSEEDRRKLNRVYDHLEAYEPMTWISRLQQWLAKAFRSLPVLTNADLSGPDVKTGEPFKYP